MLWRVGDRQMARHGMLPVWRSREAENIEVCCPSSLKSVEARAERSAQRRHVDILFGVEARWWQKSESVAGGEYSGGAQVKVMSSLREIRR